MARVCAPCYKGDHPDCARYLVRDHPCRCVCDDAPRQLHLPLGKLETPAPTAAITRPAAGAGHDTEVPW